MSFVRSPLRLAAAGLALLAIVAGVLYLFPADDTYIVLPDRAKPLEPRVTVGGQSPAPDAGGIYFVDVIVRKATLLEELLPSIREGAVLVGSHQINPAGVSEQQRRTASLAEMRRSKEIAAAVALRAAGYRVAVRATGVLVAQVLPGAPSAGKLQAGDAVVELAGRRIRTLSDLRRALAREKPGRRVAVKGRREGKPFAVSVTTTRHPDDPSRAFLGVAVDQAAEIELPLSVKIDIGAVGGPSAGLAFALAVLEKLGRDVDGGAEVAVTGALDLDGNVLPVGGLKQKTIGARRSGVDVFVVPAGENAREARANAGPLRIVPVRSFREALRVLATEARRASE